MRMFILFFSDGCEPCREELQEAEAFSKEQALTLNGGDNLMLVNLKDPKQRPWADMFTPQGTPSMIVVQCGSLDKLAETIGRGCIDAAYKTVGVEMAWTK
jgi:hypothetical protein